MNRSSEVVIEFLANSPIVVMPLETHTYMRSSQVEHRLKMVFRPNDATTRLVTPMDQNLCPRLRPIQRQATT
jgi:hypothetical protein